MLPRPLSRAASPIPPSNFLRYGSDHLALNTPKPHSATHAEFEIERITKTPNPQQSVPMAMQGYENTAEFRDYVLQLLEATTAPFTVSGRFRLEATQLTLFFRTKAGITHSLDFPVDVDYSLPPSLEVLIATCRPHGTVDYGGYRSNRPSLLFPLDLPVNVSLDLASHPILDAVRNTLFPNLPPGHYLSTVKDRLEIVDAGSRLDLQPHSLRKDGRTATIIITLPSRFEGGALIVRSPNGLQEKYVGRGGTIEEIEWTAFLPDCEYEIEPVQRGCRISISYGVFLRTFGPNGSDALIRPCDEYLDKLGSILNISRGRKIAFHLEFDYPVNPAESLADSVVPLLRGGDSLLYHALKLYKLSPELHWTAGGYIWPVERSVDFVSQDIAEGHPLWAFAFPQAGKLPQDVPALRGPFGSAHFPDIATQEASNLRTKVESNGAMPLSEANITVLTGWEGTATVTGKERVYLISNGELGKLVVNVLLVVFVS
ncbi:hypothetical protein H0H93_004657 [Arthromyces matolae]|nr:hypothetical protein H0H93_004657 [Arthromyces matolae]